MSAVYDQPVPFLIYDDYLPGRELAALLEYTLEHERDFAASEVVGTDRVSAVVNPEYRRSLCLFELGNHQRTFASRVESGLERLLDQLQRPKFTPHDIETVLVASNDGEYYKHHFDNSTESLRTRDVTFSYYFHREPKAFEGGELRIYTTYLRSIITRTSLQAETIVPLQNRMVFFPSCMRHEVLPVRCPTRAFADSRFSVTGWIRR